MSTFQEMYEEYGRKVYGFLLSLSGSEVLAEELLQETFFQACSTLINLKGAAVYTPGYAKSEKTPG